ncbi:MAG: glycosyltransferase, partial [Anaerolineales bacterium]|nr:glycosyltransferase [Anaerolineales bacterium]
MGNTESLVHFLDKSGSRYEILICSNGSTDGTLKKGRFLEEKFPGKVRVFHLKKRGVGLAFEKMVKEASFNNIISVDMD